MLELTSELALRPEEMIYYTYVTSDQSAPHMTLNLYLMVSCDFALCHL